MRIIGIDPGLAILGYGIVDIEGNKCRPVDYGAITTDKDLAFPERLAKIHRELLALIDKYQPEEAAFEELFFYNNITTAISVSQARGVALLACVNKGLETFEYTPPQIKLGVVGYGQAEKHQVQEMVKMILHLDQVPKPDDVADGLAAAITHANSRKFKDQFRIR
ncbi:MAG: crossover junction endodeoxyribonuclease RuvC [Tissierellia bacterium]|nr:crossover junction endodeoxyribonuclease RuvC [Tissierellia bacterium]